MSRITERCREIQTEILKAKKAGEPIPDFSEELDRMEEWLRERGMWRDDSGGYPCPWHEHCRCTHQGCSHGWLIHTPPGRTAKGHESEHVAIMCEQCQRAKLLAVHARKQKPKRSEWSA